MSFRGSWTRQQIVMIGLGAILMTVMLMLGRAVAFAQADTPAPGAVVRVVNTDGQSLNVRAGPSTDQSIVARVPTGETLTVTGAARASGSMRWLPVRTSGGQTGWVSTDFVAVVSNPTPVPTRAVEPAATPSPAGLAASVAEQARRAREKEAPIEVEAKLKFPEVKGRDQEITVWVTRNGAPVPGATVTLETSDGDDDEHFRQLDPTNAEGWTRRTFDVRQEKGTVEIRVEAVAPDGGEGRTVASYFRR